MTNKLSLLAASTLGAVYCLGFAPFDFWPATYVAMGGLFVLLQRLPGHALKLAWLFGVGKYGFGASWIYVSIHVYGGASPLLAGFLVVIFALGVGLFMVPLGVLFKAFQQADAPVRNVTLFAGGWLLTDWLLTWFLTGFPWLFPGYAFMQTWLIGFAPVVGVLGMSALVAASAAAAGLVSAVWREKSWMVIGVATAPWLVGALLASLSFTEQGITKRVALVQGNVAQSTKWDATAADEILQTHIDLSSAYWDVDLLIWPEAAITYYPQQIENVIRDLDAQARQSGTNFVTGIPGAERLPDGDFSVYNMVLGLGLADGRFAKQHLVPFGEYVPLEGLLRGLIGFFDLPMSGMSAGNSRQPNIRTDFGSLAVAVCYEIAYPDSVRRRAQDASVLVTVSNDTWFGASIGPHQHMQIARMRAVENGMWLLRGTNNGITGIVNPRGELTARLPQFEAGVLRGEFGLMKGRTPYSIIGDAFVYVLLISLLLVVFVVSIRRKVTQRR